MDPGDTRGGILLRDRFLVMRVHFLAHPSLLVGRPGGDDLDLDGAEEGEKEVNPGIRQGGDC